jgi:membrane associated rhomboid family serine protease
MIMKNKNFESIVSFMQGASWAIVILGAYLFFTLFYPFGLIVALIGGFFGASIGLFMVIFFEMAHIKQEMHKEKIKHTALLEKMVELLSDKKLPDNR